MHRAFIEMLFCLPLAISEIVVDMWTLSSEVEGDDDGLFGRFDMSFDWRRMNKVLRRLVNLDRFTFESREDGDIGAVQHFKALAVERLPEHHSRGILNFTSNNNPRSKHYSV